MPSDRSRRSDRLRHGYTGVVAQQGRVIVDRDINALQGLVAERIAVEALDVIGPCGTPDDGFRIGLPGFSPFSPPFFSPPAGPPVESPPVTIGGAGDFLIAPGTMYVGGERAEFPPGADHPITYSYFDQPDWPAPPPPNPDALLELVYLDLTEQDVSAVEDPDLLEVALGGPDTTQRLKLLRRVRRLGVTGSDCITAWDTAVAGWAAEGLRFDPATMQLLPEVRLQVGFTEDAGTSGPCDPVATGGFLGTDNQLIRVRIANTEAGPRLIWGYDNASFLYRATPVAGDPTRLTLAADPPDGFHVPQTGQLVEILGTAAVLGREPDETDPQGVREILRVAADAEGTLRTLAQPFGPVQGDPTSFIVLTQPLPPSLVRSTLPLFLRVWQAELPLPAGGGTVTLADPATGLSTGVTVTISLPSKTPPTAGAFWQIAVRPATPQGVYPEDLLTAPQPPDGIRRWVCPLAVIDWRKRTVTNCRVPFDNLVTLTRRKPGCCTVSIAFADVTPATPLQSLLDRAAAQADTVIVCLAQGVYALPRPLRLDFRHRGMTLEGCGGAPILAADAAADLTLFADGLLVLTGVPSVTLRTLVLHPPQVPLAEALIADLSKRFGLEAGAALLRPQSSFGVRALDSPDLTLDHCTVEFLQNGTDITGDLFAAAVFLQGDCPGLAVLGCKLASGIKPTFTPLNLNTNLSAPADATTFNRSIERLTTTLAATPVPTTRAVALVERASASFSALAANRVAAGFAAAPRAIIATAGVLATDLLGDKITLACRLGRATIRDSAFASLTLATWISAIATTLRLQDNTIGGGVGGFWLETPGSVEPQELPPDSASVFLTTVFLEEWLLLFALSAAFPPPQDHHPLRRTPQVGGQTSPVRPDFTLFVLGNQIETGDPIGVEFPGATASAGLFLSLNSAELSLAGELSVIVSANRLRCAAQRNAAAALLALPARQPCAVTGNVIINQPFQTGAGRSLWVLVADSAKETNLLSVTGNALDGESNLAQIVRPGAATRPGWSSYNADPT